MHEAKQEKQMHHTLHADIMLCARTEPQRYTPQLSKYINYLFGHHQTSFSKVKKATYKAYASIIDPPCATYKYIAL